MAVDPSGGLVVLGFKAGDILMFGSVFQEKESPVDSDSGAITGQVGGKIHGPGLGLAGVCCQLVSFPAPQDHGFGFGLGPGFEPVKIR